VLGFFASDVLLLWTRNPEIASRASVLLVLLVIGAAGHGLMNLPYALLLAHGETRLPLLANTAAVVLLVPSALVATVRWQAVGAASVWVALNAAYLFALIPLIHRAILKGELRNWYRRAVFTPLLPAVAVIAAARLLLPVEGGAGTVTPVGFPSLISLPLVTTAAITASALSVNSTRHLLLRVVRSLIPAYPVASAKS
jgi:O-antigen/teichoic acid export membrane protein